MRITAYEIAGKRRGVAGRWRRSWQGRKRRAGFLPQLSEHAQYHAGSGMLSTFSASVVKRTPLVIRAVLTGGRNHFGD